MRECHGHRIWLIEHRVPSKEEIRQTAERIDVRACVDVFAAHLFGSHECRGSTDRALVRQRGLSTLRQLFDKPKIQKLRKVGAFTYSADEDVAGLDIAVNEAGLMGLLQRFAQLA